MRWWLAMPVKSVTRSPTRRAARTPLSGASVRLPPQRATLLAEYRRTITDGRLIAYRPTSGSSTQQVKGSLFSGAGTGAVTGLTTAMTFTASGGDAPTCSVAGTLTIPGDCWDIDAFLDGELWASWKGINVGGAFELDASGNGHTLYLTTTTIAEVVDGTGTNYWNERGGTVADGSQYLDEAGETAIGVGWRIPTLAGESGAASYSYTEGTEVHPAYSSLTPPPTTVIVIEGDSRSAEESPATTFWVDYITRWPVAVGQTINNYAWGGKVLSDALSGYAAGAHTKAPTAPVLGFYIAMIGANDLGTGLNRTGAAVYDDIKTLWALAKADGFKVVACAETGANGWPAANTEQQLIYNALVRSDPSLYDYLLEPDIYVPVTTAPYYIDGIHPTDDGAQALADMVAAELPHYVPHINEAKTLTLTAQEYCLQVLGTGGVVVKSGASGANLAPGGGTFDTGLTGYNNGGGLWSWADGQPTCNHPETQSALVGLNAVAGTTYTVFVDIIAISSGGAKLTIGGFYSELFTTTGTKTFTATAGSAVCGVSAWNASGLVIDNLKYYAHTNTNVATGTPLQFTAVDGASIFTPNESCTGWMLTADGGGVLPYIYPSTSAESTIGVDMIRSPITIPGPLSRSATVTAGTTLADAKLKFPLGPKFQGITELGGEAVVDLATRVNTDQVVFGARYGLVYSVPLSAADLVLAEKYCGA